MSKDGLIPSPFWQPNHLPPEVQKEVDLITKEMQPAIQRLSKLTSEYNLNCFQISGGVNGVGITLGVHNPAAPHPQLPKEVQDILNNPEEVLRSMGVPVPPGSEIRVSHRQIPKDGQSLNGCAVASSKAPQEQPRGVQPPPNDLVVGIQTLLRQFFPTVKDVEVLGTVISPHHNAAVQIAKIMDTARVRDRNEVLRRVTEFLNSFKQ